MDDDLYLVDGQPHLLRTDPHTHPYTAHVTTACAGWYGTEHGDRGADRYGLAPGDAVAAVERGVDLLHLVWGCLEIAYDNHCARRATAGRRHLTIGDLGLVLTGHASAHGDPRQVGLWARFGPSRGLLAVSVAHDDPTDATRPGVVTDVRSTRPDRQHRRLVPSACWLHRCCTEVRPPEDPPG